MKASLVLANWLKSIGVKNIFGVTGGSVVHLLHGAEAVGINVIYTHHEQAASFAAEAASRTSEKISVCMVTTGPGGTNAIGGLTESWVDSVPILVISGQTFSHQISNKARSFGLQGFNIIDNVKIELMYFYNLIELTLIHLINKVKESVMEGVVKWFNFQKGYGFITPTGDEKDVFVHKTSLEKNGIRTLTEGQKVTFEVAVNKGKSSAVNIKLT